MWDKIDSESTDVRSLKWILSGQLQASQDVSGVKQWRGQEKHWGYKMINFTVKWWITDNAAYVWDNRANDDNMMTQILLMGSLLNAQYVISVASGLCIKSKQKTSGKGCASQLHRRESGAEPNFLEE